MDERALSRGRRLRLAAAAWLGALVVRGLGATWRVRLDGHLPGPGPVVLALWHGELLPLLWGMRGRGYAPLISTHADGEVIARIVKSLGFVPIRGSSSRGGARALIEATRRLSEGVTVAFTTDGPRGPRRRSAPGAAAAAARGGVPLVPLGAAVDRAWRLRSWDRFVIPKPFARVVVRIGAPVAAEDGAGTARLDEALLAICQPDAPDA